MKTPTLILLATFGGLISLQQSGFGDAMAEPLSPFGIGSSHVNNRSVTDNARWIPQMAELGIRVHRTPRTAWSALEQKEGEWNWKALDEQLVYLEKNGFTFGATLIGNPKWNTKDPAGNLPVNHLPGWSNYVTKLVSHLKGRVTRYEVWNEPPNFTGKDQTPADYARIVVAAYDAAKAADPDCLVGLAAKSAHIHYLEETIRAGAKDHFDFITLHPYEILDGVAENKGSESVLLHVVPVLRKMLAAVNPAKVDVPVIYTELGVSSEKGLDKQASALIKAYTLSIAGGVECIQWFEGRDGDSGPLGLLDREGQARPAYHALGAMIRHLGQHPKYLGWTLLNEHHYAFAFTGAKGPVMVTWAAPGAPASTTRVDFGGTVEIVNPVGSSESQGGAINLTELPVFVSGFPEEYLQEVIANRGKPFPWSGDFSEVNEVSIQFGEEVIERGLHTRSGDQAGKAVVAYGGSAREGSVPGGNVFTVDPNFLSYEKTPIEVEVVVRRNPENVNAGFKLVYESVDGYKTAGGWYTVPDNKEWHTKTWRIDDPKFVNYWGYNFVLESDGNVHNKYLIKSIKVTKMAD